MGLNSGTPKRDESLIRIEEGPNAGGSITHTGRIVLVDDGKTPDCTEIRKSRNRWLKKNHKLGTWNSRSMAVDRLSTIIEKAKAK